MNLLLTGFSLLLLLGLTAGNAHAQVAEKIKQ